MANQDHRRIPVSPGRPKAVLDERLLLESQNLDYDSKRIAREYSEMRRQYVSHMTVWDRLRRMESNGCQGSCS